MLKLMKRDEENGDRFETEDEHGVKRQVLYEADDDLFVLGNAPLNSGYHDDLDELDGIVPGLDRTLEDCQIALERLQKERGRALRENHLALYLALETKVAQLSGYLQGLAFVREHLGNHPPGPGLLAEGADRVSLDDSAEAQAKLGAIVQHIEELLKRRAEQKDLN